MKRLLIIVVFALSCGAANAQFFAAKGGLAAGAASAGVEVAAGKQWSVEVAGYWNPARAERFSARAWWVQPAVKYWLYEHFVGHFAALHPAYGKYDIGNDRWHYEGSVAGVGMSYGYSWMLGMRLNLTIEGGIGVYRMEDRKRRYQVDDWVPERIVHYRRTVLAPSKLEVAINYLF
jgi:hypothetical protein